MEREREIAAVRTVMSHLSQLNPGTAGKSKRNRRKLSVVSKI
jgi:hypothetical protein